MMTVVCCLLLSRSADCVSFAPSSVPSLPAPNAHSSPLSGPRARVLQQTFEEKFSLGPALEGLDYQQNVLLASDSEHSQGSASPSGFSSPHSGSSLSIPFPSVLPELQSRANPAASDLLSSKQLTVKFVQDTSKYWYKPDIARDQGRVRSPDGTAAVFDAHLTSSLFSRSYRHAEGQRARLVHRPGQSLLQRRVWTGHESDHTAGISTAEQER